MILDGGNIKMNEKEKEEALEKLSEDISNMTKTFLDANIKMKVGDKATIHLDNIGREYVMERTK